MQNALLQTVRTEMCVSSVCTQPPYNDKDLFNLLNNFPFLKCLSVWCHTDKPLPRLLIDTSVLPQTRPEWAAEVESNELHLLALL